MIWSVNKGENVVPFTPTRPQDKSFVGNILEAMIAYGKAFFVYSCYNQDQDLDKVDFPNLNARLKQNTVQEKLSNLWLDYLLTK